MSVGGGERIMLVHNPVLEKPVLPPPPPPPHWGPPRPPWLFSAPPPPPGPLPPPFRAPPPPARVGGPPAASSAARRISAFTPSRCSRSLPQTGRGPLPKSPPFSRFFRNILRPKLPTASTKASD